VRLGEVVVVVEALAFFHDFGKCTVAACAQRGCHRRNVNKCILRTQRGILGAAGLYDSSWSRE